MAYTLIPLSPLNLLFFFYITHDQSAQPLVPVSPEQFCLTNIPPSFPRMRPGQWDVWDENSP